MSDDTFFKKWLEGKITEEQIANEGIKMFENKESFENYKMFVDGAQNLKVPSEQTKEQAWNDLIKKIELSEETSALKELAKTIPIYKRRFFKIASMAATVALIFVAILLINRTNQISYLTGNGETKTIVLPDNSSITLNADSRISFNESNWLDNRIVSLSGEAFFVVKKGTKFEVISEVGKVGVLGTSFNVKAREDQYEVACFTGRVEVFVKHNTLSKILTKGLSTRIDNQQLTDPVGFKPKQVVGWQSGSYYFEEEALITVFGEVERQFNVTLKLETPVEGRIYSGHFNKNNLNDALELVCLPMNLKFDIINDDTVVISR